MVYFVGAGPGAPDLITLRGARLLGEADVVIYAGSLVNPELLSYCRPGTEIYNSAKMTLPQVVEVIRQAEEEGRTTVRLHTGDPSLYGAIREQIDALKKLGIEWEICPGVSSMSAAAAALSAEYTLPGVSQTVIITRIAGRTSVPEKESLRNLAQAGATMVLFLSIAYVTGYPLRSRLQGKLAGAEDRPGTSGRPCENDPGGGHPEDRADHCRRCAG